jgi:UDP-glucose 4-epimerase
VQNAHGSLGRAAGGGQGTRILVIGCGFIGSHIVEALVQSGRPPVVLTRSRPEATVIAMLGEGDLHLGEIMDREALEAALDDAGHVVFSAGGLLPAASEQNPELDAKLTLGPLRSVLSALADRPAVAFTYLSSGGTVYGEPARVPVNESDSTHPLGAYGKLHLACEEIVMRRRIDLALRARILRCATVYGEYQQPDRGQGAVVTFLHRIEHGRPIDLYGGGTTVRDYVYAGDVARAVVALLDRADGPPILNVASGKGTSLLQLLHMAEGEVGKAARIVAHPKRSFEVERIILDPSRLQGLIDFKPTRLEDGISHTQTWLTKSVPERV